MKTFASPIGSHLRFGSCMVLLLGLLARPGLAADFYADDQDSLVKAIGDAADSGAAENFINLDRAGINTADVIVIDGRFGPGHRLTIRPRPGLSTRPRTQFRAINGAVPIVHVHNAGYVTLQDLDLLRATYNRANLLQLENVTNVVVERCRVGSISSSGGQSDKANIYARNPVRTVVRNTICFAYWPGTLDEGIVVFQDTGRSAGFWLYNTLVADHRLHGIHVTAAGDSVVVLRNNVVVNHPAAIVPEPSAYRSNLDPFVTVISSHNVAFASAVATKIEQQDGVQDIANSTEPDFLRQDRVVAAFAFHQMRWITQPEANPNWNLFRLRDDGPLHERGSVRGVTVDRGSFDPFVEGSPDELDIALTDDIEKDARPTADGGVSHTDRGPDQFRQLTAGDITIDLRPRLRGLEPVRMSGGGFEIDAVGPQEDLPDFGEVMSSGNHTAGGRLSGIMGMALGLPRPVVLAIQFERGTGELRFSWPILAEGYAVDEVSAFPGGGTPDPSSNWKPVPQPPMVDGDNFTLRVTPSATGNRFYRLRKLD